MYEIWVGKAGTVKLSEADADTIVDAIRKGPYLPPNVMLKRAGAVDSCHGPSVIRSREDRDSLFAGSAPSGPFRICVVEGLEWCEGRPAPPLDGCSDLPGKRIVVARTMALEPLLWAHEFSHARGNDHRFDADALMYPEICGKCTLLNATETKTLRESPPVQLARLTGGKPESFSREVLLRDYVHGVPLATFMRIKDQDEGTIRSVLNDAESRAFHANALIALAFLPNGRAFGDLRKYVESTEAVDVIARRNRRAAVLASGYLLALHKGNEDALGYLMRITDPAELPRLSPPWIGGDVAIENKNLRARYEPFSLALSAITALGLSGRKEAAEYLKRLESEGADGNRLGPVGMRAIGEALRTNSGVQAKGLQALQPE